MRGRACLLSVHAPDPGLRRTADGGRQTAVGAWRLAVGGWTLSVLAVSRRRREESRRYRRSVSADLDEPVHVEEWDPAWQTSAAAVVAECRAALGEHALAVEHIGSTAVPGLAAKPAIDVLVGVRRGRQTAAAEDQHGRARPRASVPSAGRCETVTSC